MLNFNTSHHYYFPIDIVLVSHLFIRDECQRTIMGNHTKLTVFILAGLTDDPLFKVMLFLFLLLTYLLSIMGNLTIITLTLLDTHLKTPMYFFLRNFSFLEISYTTTCIPKLLAVMATVDKTIS